jgi:benzil reductase ((S)-benzoin forming)
MKLVVLSGCTRGLGLALHNDLAELAGDFLTPLFIGRKLERISKTPAGVYVECDLRKPQLLENICTLIPQGVSDIVFINNAGTISPIAPVHDLACSDIVESYAVNISAPSIISSRLAKYSVERGIPLGIINVTSGAAKRVIEGWSLYCASKSALVMFLDVLAAENSCVDVIHFDPGVMETGMQCTIRQTAPDKMPQVSLFRSFYENGSLKDVRAVSREIIARCGIL